MVRKVVKAVKQAAKAGRAIGSGVFVIATATSEAGAGSEIQFFQPEAEGTCTCTFADGSQHSEYTTMGDCYDFADTLVAPSDEAGGGPPSGECTFCRDEG